MTDKTFRRLEQFLKGLTLFNTSSLTTHTLVVDTPSDAFIEANAHWLLFLWNINSLAVGCRMPKFKDQSITQKFSAGGCWALDRSVS